MISGTDRIDLHMHTTVSDGTDTPEELLAFVREAKLGLFSVTDHDAVKGCRSILAIRKPDDPLFLCGVEFSCKDEGGKYHILGYGYDVDATQSHAVLLGGGVGVPPLYKLAKDLVAAGKKVSVILGFNTQSEIFYEQQFASLGAKVLVTTVDGSYGIKGFVTDALKLVEGYDYFYTCGPEPMLKAVYNATTTSGQFSFEERMGCGFGACMGCSCETKYKTLRICKEGPVLTKEVIVW